jgi:hypothetical protein
LFFVSSSLPFTSFFQHLVLCSLFLIPKGLYLIHRKCFWCL